MMPASGSYRPRRESAGCVRKRIPARRSLARPRRGSRRGRPDDAGTVPPCRRLSRGQTGGSMGWVAIPDSFGDDPRLIDLGHEAFARLVRLWCYCGRHENDGILSTAVLNELIVERVVQRLVERGFLRVDGDTAVVVGFTDHNMTHAARQAQRDANREAGILSGKARREKAILERTKRSTDRSTDRRTPGPGPEHGMEYGTGTEESAASPPVSASPSTDVSRDTSNCPELPDGSQRPRAPRKPPTGDHAEIIALWCSLFEGIAGSRPTIGAKDGAAVARLLKAHRGDRALIEARMRRCFDERVPSWAWQDGPPTLAAFCGSSIFDRLATVTPSTNGFHRATTTNGRPSAISFLTDP